MFTRRNFLRGSVGALALGGGLPSVLERALAAQAAQDPQAAKKPGRVLVVLQLTGGNDGLSTVIPFEDDAYWKARPTIAPDKKDLRKISSAIALHPSLKKCEAAFAEGRLAVIQGVGYPGPNRSHFHSMDVWHTADPELRTTRAGWLGRAIDAPPAARGNALFAFHIGDEAPRALLSQTQRATSFSSLQDYAIQADRNAPNDRAKIEAAFEAMTAAAESDRGAIGLVRRTAAQAVASAKELKSVLGKSATTAVYPGSGLAQQLRLAAQVIGAELPVRIVSLQMGGFDLHANEKGSQANLLTTIDDALAAFRDDLVQRKREGDVVVIAFSEFGRRLSENGSAGTDHGAAGPMLVFGDPVKGGLVGEHQSLVDLDEGDREPLIVIRRA